MYQVGYTLPRFQQLVGSHLQRGGTSPVAALAALAAFGVVIVTHTFVQVAPPNCTSCSKLMLRYHFISAISATILTSEYEGEGSAWPASDPAARAGSNQACTRCRAGCTGRRAPWRLAWSAR